MITPAEERIAEVSGRLQEIHDKIKRIKRHHTENGGLTNSLNSILGELNDAADILENGW